MYIATEIEIDKCIELILSKVDIDNPCYDTFCDECVKTLVKEGFAIDTELLENALSLSSEEHFELTNTTETRKREIYCFNKIQEAFKPYTFEPVL